MPKQIIISYPEGYVVADDGTLTANRDIAEQMISRLREGYDLVLPSDWEIQVVDLNEVKEVPHVDNRN